MDRRIILFPCASGEAKLNFERTIGNRDAGDIALWGVKHSGQSRRSKWGSCRPGDVALFSAKRKIFSAAFVLGIEESPRISNDAWGSSDFSLLFSLHMLKGFEPVPVEVFNAAAKYQPNNNIQGFDVLSGDKVPPILQALLPRIATGLPPPPEAAAAGAAAAGAAEVAFPALLDQISTVVRRCEARSLRAYLFPNDQHRYKCTLCGRRSVPRLQVVAHIKPRSRCNDGEKRNLANVMRACLFGCDSLFEWGYISVERGWVVMSPECERAFDHDLHNEITNRFTNRRVEYADAEQVTFFDWHCTNRFRR